MRAILAFNGLSNIRVPEKWEAAIMCYSPDVQWLLKVMFQCSDLLFCILDEQ